MVYRIAGENMICIIRKRVSLIKTVVSSLFLNNLKTDMKDLRLKFKGIDDWNRPVFMDDNGRYFGDTDHLFDYTASKDDVLNFYRNMPLNNCICYFGQQFGCEPMGIEIKSNVKIILE